MASELQVNTITEATSGSGITFAKDVIPATPLSHRNMIINGAMQVSQIGDGQTHASSSTAYTACDRFQLYHSNNGAATTNHVAGPTEHGFANALHVDITTLDTGLTATDRADIIYSFEGKDLQHICKGTSAAKAVTLSFWVKSPKTGIHVVEFYDTDNSRHVCKTYTVAAANTWEKHSVSIPADTTGAFTNDVNKSLEVHWWLLAGSNYTSGTLQTTWGSPTTANRAVGQVNVYDNASNNFYLTGVQLELGTVATPFEHKSYQDELQRCKRYFQLLGSIIGTGYQNGVDAVILSGSAGGLKDDTGGGKTGGGGTLGAVGFRADPTITGTFGAASIGSSAGTSAFSSNTVSNINWDQTNSTVTLQTSSTINSNGSGNNIPASIYFNSKTILFKAEL